MRIDMGRVSALQPANSGANAKMEAAYGVKTNHIYINPQEQQVGLRKGLAGEGILDEGY